MFLEPYLVEGTQDIENEFQFVCMDIMLLMNLEMSLQQDEVGDMRWFNYE